MESTKSIFFLFCIVFRSIIVLSIVNLGYDVSIFHFYAFSAIFPITKTFLLVWRLPKKILARMVSSDFFFVAHYKGHFKINWKLISNNMETNEATGVLEKNRYVHLEEIGDFAHKTFKLKGVWWIVLIFASWWVKFVQFLNFWVNPGLLPELKSLKFGVPQFTPVFLSVIMKTIFNLRPKVIITILTLV